MIEAGRLTRQIDILTVAVTKNAYGEMINTYSTTIAPIWADVKPLSGTEYFQVDQPISESQLVFTMRYTTLITPDASMIVRYNSLDYNIKAVIDKDDMRVRYDLICNRVAT